jgi:hypothetical protein
MEPEPVFVNLLRSPGIDSQPSGPVQVDNPICRTGPPGYIGWRIDSSESIPGFRKRLQIRALAGRYNKKDCRTGPLNSWTP